MCVEFYMCVEFGKGRGKERGMDGEGEREGGIKGGGGERGKDGVKGGTEQESGEPKVGMLERRSFEQSPECRVQSA